ncbi:MAG: hypothetical protein AABO57_16440 [Acidobacteriota bacterium]
MKRIVVFALCLIVVLVAAAQARSVAPLQANVAGTWDITIDSPQGQNKAMLVLKKEGDKLTGSMKSARGERPLESVTVAGGDITFVVKANIQGQDMVFTYKGKVEKDSMKGDADFGGLATGTWSAVPHKEDAAAPATSTAAPAQAGGINISGDWAFMVETGQGSGSPSFSFKQDGEKLTGTYKGQFGEAPLTGTVKGADIKFVIKVNAQGQDLTITYSGKIESKDSMKGTAALGELGEATWTAKRK